MFFTDPDNTSAPICLMAMDVNPPAGYPGDSTAFGFDKDGPPGVTITSFIGSRSVNCYHDPVCDTYTCTADITGDGKVNLSDLIQMKIQYNSTGCVTTCR